MINSEEFALRLQKILDYYNESAASFAEKIGVQRSSISHILSGRNKLSLDFVTKILHAYSEINLYWLINGKGEFLKQTEKSAPLREETPKTVLSTDPQEIEQIIIFYKNGNFKNYTP